jgi:hypothetical protein
MIVVLLWLMKVVVLKLKYNATMRAWPVSEDPLINTLHHDLTLHFWVYFTL